MKRAPRGLHRWLLALEPELAHHLVVRSLVWLGRLGPLRAAVRKRYGLTDSRLAQDVLGLRFTNPVGLAAGFDKNGVALRGLSSLGFGFLEVGTVTPLAQRGNPRPRVFRYPEFASLQNALGFNNAGLGVMQASLVAAGPRTMPVGVNIGKNRATPAAAAVDDYAALFRGLTGRCDYFVINVSSPNTPGLRDLQSEPAISELVECGRELASEPILVKLAPDLDPARAQTLGRAVVEAGAAGLVLTNTTTDYSLLPGARTQGGLSGRVLRERSFEILQAAAAELYGRCLLISVGGIDSADEAYRRLRAGASLVQVYTGLVFQGPSLVHTINQGLLDRLERDGAGSVREIVGRDLPGRPRRQHPADRIRERQTS